MRDLTFAQIKEICAIVGAEPTELPTIFDSGDWLLLDDREASEVCFDYIKDSLWAFNASFLSGETGIDQEVFEAIHANGRCESNNYAVESMIRSTCGLASFVESAVQADGRGHFISSYDGEEHEIFGELYLYRIN